jgi:DNA invertase Pin-like site-specific DNA recombinase/uncharacterized coiled-coil protein SlyX
MTKGLTAAIDTAARGVRVATLRAVDYLRVSTEEQAEGYGIAYSGKKTARYIERKGWAHVGTYADEGLSGSLEAGDRPDLRRLMADSLKTPRPFDMVVVNEGRVIGRTGRAFWRWVWELEDLGVYVAVVKKDYDNSTAHGRSQMRKDADYAEEERELIRERTQAGIQEKAEEGGYVGGVVPFGWEVVDQGKKISRYGVCEAEAQVLRRARDLFLEHRSWTAAALLLNSEGMYSKSGRPWSGKNLSRRLLGDAATKNRVVWRGRQAAKRPDGTLIYGEQVIINLPPIFSEEEIAELESAAAAMPKYIARNGSRIYTLTGRLVSPCGATYSGHNQHPGSYVYRCKGREESFAGAGDTCDCPPLDVEPLERKVWGDVRATLGDAERMKALAQDWGDSFKTDHVDYVGRIAALDQQIAEQQQTINVTMAVAARQAIKQGMSAEEAEASVERTLKPLNENLEELEKLRREALAWQRDAAEAGDRARQFERLAEAARANMQDLGPQEQVELYAALGMEAVVLHSPKRRLGVPCAVTAWFNDNGRLVPTLTDEGWERIEHLVKGRRSDVKHDRRGVVEALLLKARTGVKYRDLPPGSAPAHTLQTTANRWMKDGTWAQAMELLKDEPGQPAWKPDPVRVEVSLKPLAIECRCGEEESGGWVGGRDTSLKLTFQTAA